MKPIRPPPLLKDSSLSSNPHLQICLPGRSPSLLQAASLASENTSCQENSVGTEAKVSDQI